MRCYFKMFHGADFPNESMVFEAQRCAGEAHILLLWLRWKPKKCAIWQTSQFLCHDSVGKCFAQFCFMRQSAPVSRASCRGHASLRPSEHATGNEFAVESTGWRPQSQRYGQISLPTSTKKVHQEVAGKIVLAALGTNGSALQYASERLRTDPKFVLSAVTQQGRALEHAPATLRANKDIVMTS